MTVGTARADTLVLLWDQNPEPNVTAYRVFVGTAPGSYSETFDVPGDQASFIYATAARGRRYYFAVAAQVDDVVWGPRSLEVSETANGSLSVPPDGRSSMLLPQGEVSGARLDVIATGLQSVGALAVSTTGIGLLVESDRVVRAFAASGLQADPSLTLEEDARIEDLTMASDFDRSGRVWLAVSRTRRDGARELTIERHRFLAGSLGEGAAVVPGLAAEPSTHVALASDADGLVFVAEPGAVLAFDANGRVPEGQPSRSPVLGAGPTDPLTAAWDEAAQSIWVAGRDAQGGPVVERLSISGVSRDSRTLSFDVPASAPRAAIGMGGRPQVVVATPGALVVFDLASGSRTEHPLNLAAHGDPVLLGPAGESTWYVVVRRHSGREISDTLVRVTDPTSLPPQP